jgi:hypothetical protein
MIPDSDPGSSGMTNWTGCRIKSGMTVDMFHGRSHNGATELRMVYTLAPSEAFLKISAAKLRIIFDP